MVADKFCEIAESIGGAEAKSDDLVDGFVKLLSDEEAEVRTAAAAKVGGMISYFLWSFLSSCIFSAIFSPSLQGVQIFFDAELMCFSFHSERLYVLLVVVFILLDVILFDSHSQTLQS
jgi:hypothetical protein